MILSLTQDELIDYTSRQLNYFFPDKNVINLHHYKNEVTESLNRLENCFNKVTLRHYNNGEEVLFNHLYSDHYIMYVWYLGNTIWKNTQNKELCNKLYYLNKTLHAFDCMFDTKLPDIFLIFHGAGTMLGKAIYDNYFVALQGVTIGSHKGKYPIIGKGVSLTAHSSIIGDCTISNNVSISIHTTIFQKDIPANQSVFLDAKTGELTFRTSSVSYAQQFFTNDLVIL